MDHDQRGIYSLPFPCLEPPPLKHPLLLSYRCVACESSPLNIILIPKVALLVAYPRHIMLNPVRYASLGHVHSRRRSEANAADDVHEQWYAAATELTKVRRTLYIRVCSSTMRSSNRP